MTKNLKEKDLEKVQGAGDPSCGDSQMPICDTSRQTTKPDPDPDPLKPVGSEFQPGDDDAVDFGQ